jgi:hypothetical protein
MNELFTEEEEVLSQISNNFALQFGEEETNEGIEEE